MANVLNPEPESITLNTELETPTLEPATELVQPLSESTSNTENTEAVATTALDADTLTPEPEVEAVFPVMTTRVGNVLAGTVLPATCAEMKRD